MLILSKADDKEVTEKFSGEGKFYNGEEFLADVRYDLRLEHTVHQHIPSGQTTVAYLEINPTDKIHASFTDNLVLVMNDGRRQAFCLFDGSCETAWGRIRGFVRLATHASFSPCDIPRISAGSRSRKTRYRI
jgi:hypothetical protein